MRQKVRRISKSTISVLLAIMMVVSLVTVGIINTSANTFTTSHKIYFDATKWTSRSKVYVNFLNKDRTWGNLQEMTQIGSTGIYRYENSSVSGSDNFGVMFVTNDGWDTAGDWKENNSYAKMIAYASNCTKYYRLDLNKDHVYYFRASGANKDEGLELDHDYDGTQYTINHDTVRNTDRVWAFNLTATSSVANTAAGTPATGNASSSAGGKITVNASYFSGWDSVSGTGDCADSSTTTTYSNAAKGCTATWKVKQVYSGYEFDGWYSDASSTGTTNRLSTNQNYTETVTGDINGTITRYAHFHRAKSTVNTAVSPSGAGTAYISNSSTIGTDTSVSNITDGETVYLKATANTGYTFSKWRTASGLSYDNANDASTTATVTANATATAEFTANTYTITKQNPDHAKIKVPAKAAYNSNVKLSATTDLGHKVSSYKYSTNGGSTWTPISGDSFTMPAHDVVVSADVDTCSTYQVTMTPSGNGSITARTSDGVLVSSGDSVNDGTVITFTASAAENNAFGGWSGTGSASSFSGTAASKTATITADTTVTASFSENVVQVAYYGTTESASATPSNNYSMTLLDSGYYRSSTKLNNGDYFTVKKTVGGVTTYAKSGAAGTAWYINSGSPVVTPQHWTSNNTLSKKYKNDTGSASYVFYNPAQNKIWLSTSADGLTGVTIYAKDGSFTGDSPGATPSTSAGWGSTTLKVSTNGGSTWSDGTDVFDGNAQTATLTSAQVDSASTKIKVSTTVSESGYYVYGYDINGCITKTATDIGSNTYELEFSPSDVETNLAGYIEITPIYMLIDPSTSDPGAATNTIRFYVRGFSGDVEARWGGELYCYAYEDESTKTNGEWPGQPMVNLGGGTYYMDLPLNTKAITLSNAAADWVHAKVLGVDLTVENNWKTRNEYQCQSYDYDDFQYIYAKPKVGANDEDIIFDFRYKQGEWGISGKDNFNTVIAPDSSSTADTSFPDTLTPGDYSGWEKYTDFYDEPIDLWGTKLTGNYNNNPVRVVVQGYYDTSAANSSYYATTYVVYKPDNFTGDPGEYKLVNYTTGSDGYGKLSRSEFLQKTAAEMNNTSGLAGQPVEITYEYAIYHDVSTKQTKEKDNQNAERADGVWYYSETKPIKGKVLIQYAENMRSAFYDDGFAIDEDPLTAGYDYDGDPWTVNEGTVTKAKAYFQDNNTSNTNRPTGAPFDVNYTNRTVEWAYSDGNEYYEVKAEDPADGEYTFVGWYMLSSSGIDLATTDYTYSFEATTNETFIARYVKVPSGVVKLAHKPVVTGNSGGNGERKVWYDIVDSNNASVLPSGTTQEANGAITVPKTYVKHDKGYTLKVKFQVVADQYSKKHGIYSANEAVDANLLDETQLESHNHSIDVDSFTLSPSGTTATLTTDYVTFSIPMDRFFKLVQGTGGDTGVPAEYEFDTEKSLIEVFSDFEQLKSNINITKSVDYNNGDSFEITVQEQYEPDPVNNPGTMDWRNYTGKYTVDDETTQNNFTGTIDISGGQTIHIIDVPAGVVLRVSETNMTNVYQYGGVTISNATGSDIAQGKQFTMPPTNSVDMTFKNSIKTENVVITKTVEGGTPPSGTTFPIHVTYQTTNGTTVTPHTNEAITTLAVGTNVTLSNVPVGSLITISEDSKTGYECMSITGRNITDNKNNSEFQVIETSDTPTITVTNTPTYQYEIKYIYEGYSATTYNSDGSSKVGPTRFFKATGELSSAQWNKYFDATNNSFTSDTNARQFLSDRAPLEDDFMMDLSWDPMKIDNLNVDATNKKVTLEVTATTAPNREVYVYFQLPYDVDANLVAVSGATYNTNTQQHVVITQYGKWVKKNDAFITAPLTLTDNNGETHYFRYWQIRSTDTGRNAGKVETNYKKCFYADFNMTMYQDSYVEAVYTTDVISYDPGAQSLADTTNGEARINFIENSRNQWNSDGAPDLSNLNQKKAGDRVYADFLLTFGYKDKELNTVGNSSNIETGFVVEKVALLDTDDYGYKTKTQSEYHADTAYGSSEEAAKAKVADFVKSTKTTDTGVTVKDGVTSNLITKQSIQLAQLDNKNQMKYSLNMKNKEYGTNATPTDPYMNYVYRAYSYIKIGDAVVVSDPTYFTIYDIASIEPKA